MLISLHVINVNVSTGSWRSFDAEHQSTVLRDHMMGWYSQSSDVSLPPRSLTSGLRPSGVSHPRALSASRMLDIPLVSADSPRVRDSGTGEGRIWRWGIERKYKQYNATPHPNGFSLVQKQWAAERTWREVIRTPPQYGYTPPSKSKKYRLKIAPILLIF